MTRSSTWLGGVMALYFAAASACGGSRSSRGEAPAEARFTREIPWAGRGSWIKVDTHMHTTFSDGAHSLAEVVTRAIEHGCRAIAITDHADRDLKAATAEYAAAIQGIRSQLDRFYLSGRTPTLRDIATRKVSIDSKPYIGTPERVAEELASTIDAVGGDGFAIRQGIWPGYVGPFVDKVIPLLQKRGAIRKEYTGTTLREHLREF